MRLTTGIDLIEIDRIRAAQERYGARFLERIFTAREQSDCANKAESLAARFAAKEAAAKALGCGIGAVSWLDIEVVLDDRRAPALHLIGPAAALAAEKGLSTWSLSLSHSRGVAAAVVVATGA